MIYQQRGLTVLQRDVLSGAVNHPVPEWVRAYLQPPFRNQFQVLIANGWLIPVPTADGEAFWAITDAGREVLAADKAGQS